MAKPDAFNFTPAHDHVFLGEDHEAAERRTWIVIWVCAAMMAAEIIGGGLFGSIALIADGLHMSTHAGALLLAALAYTYARKHANDPRFTFGTGKFGDLAGFSSAIILAMIALLIGYESVMRFFHPVAIHFGEAIPIAVLGLAVNIASVWLLSGGHHHHGHGHSHDHAHDHDEDPVPIATARGSLALEIFEDGVPARFRLEAHESGPDLESLTTDTIRPDGTRQTFNFARKDGYWESEEEIPEPHAFTAEVRFTLDGQAYHQEAPFEEHDHGHAGAHDHDNNMRAAIVHVIADAAVSVLVIIGLLLARVFGWLWMDPIAGVVGALVIANWSYGLIRDTGAILLDRVPDLRIASEVRKRVEQDGDTLTDLHLWRLGPGHLGVIVSVATNTPRQADDYRRRLDKLRISHMTVEVQNLQGTPPETA